MKKEKKKKSPEKNNIKMMINIYLAKTIMFDIIMLALGIICMTSPYASLRIFEVIFATILVIFGATNIFDFAARKTIKIFKLSLVYGILSMLMGLFIYLNPLAIINTITIIFGIWLAISGVIKIDNSRIFYTLKEDIWIITLVIGILITVFGILVILNPFVNLYITELVGLFLIIYAILDFTCFQLFKNKTKEITGLFK